ncbi:MAG TPA: DUF1552 domain-containing protein [Isosphaeraceae bacterium]|jgi:hypothetical protein
MSRSRTLSRRAALRGLGTAITLPWLEAMAPLSARAAEAAIPKRLAFFYVPNGVHMPDWTPKAEGPLGQLPGLLEPLAALKDDILVLTGLAQDGGWAHGDGPGDHARSLASFLTGVHPLKTDGANIRAGISVDQVAAQALGKATRLPSLELGCEAGAQSGNCDSGYSCAYSSNISWRSASTPAPKEINPRLVFDRLFSADDAEATGLPRARRDRYRRSILDFVADDARKLRARLGTTDRGKVEEYLTSVRELEQRLEKAAHAPADAPPDFARPKGLPKDYGEHVRLMCDLMALAFQADVTRVATFVYSNEASNRSYPALGVSEGHHSLSHHGGDAEKHKKLRLINRFHLELFAGFLARLKATREGDGTLLDRALIVYGSGISDGDRHNHDDLPILLAGRGAGTVRPGRHIRYAKNTPLNNLYLSMLDGIGAPVDSLGDSSGRLPTLSG